MATCVMQARGAVMVVAVRPETDSAGLSGATTLRTDSAMKNSTRKALSKETVALTLVDKDGYLVINKMFCVVYCCAPI